MKLTGSGLIALAILLASIVLTLGSRYQIVSASNDSTPVAYKLDRFSGTVTYCHLNTCAPAGAAE